MIESQWRTATNPKPMLEFLCRKATAQKLGPSWERKLRRFACTCVRRLEPILKDDRLWSVVSAVEEATETENPEDLLRACHEDLTAIETPAWANDDTSWRSCRDAIAVLTKPQAKQAAKAASEKAKLAAGCDAWFAVQPTGQPKIHAGHSSDPKIKPLQAALNRAWAIERQAQSRLLRDIFGPLPFRSIAIDPAWRTPPVMALAGTIHAEKAFEQMPILADALEEAGCSNADILTHCREAGVHGPGCWCLDLLLGKE